MTIALVATIAFSLLQGAASPVNAGRIPLPPPVFSPAPTPVPVCPLNFCDDFLEVCESSGTPEDSCGQSLKACEPSPCDACDAALAACNKADGKHCDEIATKCRAQLVGCCELTVYPACSSTETIGDFLPTYCDEHPLGRPAQCTTGLASSMMCIAAIKASDGNDITTCDYIDCVKALQDAPCDLIPDACIPFADFVE